MKKTIKYILIVLLLLLTAYFLANKFKTHHTVKYKIKEKNNIQILETYHKDKISEYYLLEIKQQDKTFVFDINNHFNKKKKIIKDVVTFKKEDITCVYPILIDENYTLEIMCDINKKLYSYNSIKDKYDLSKFTSNIPNYSDKYYKDKTNNIKNYDDIKVYNDNIYTNENIIIYNYKNLIKITNDSYSKIPFSNYDVYNNNLGVLINNIYLIPKYTKRPEISTYYAINILNEKKAEIKLDNKLSTNLYINGIVDNKLYIFDKSDILQYEIDPSNKKAKKVGDKNSIKFYDGKWIQANPYDYVQEQKIFNTINSKTKFPFQYDAIYPSDYYYIFSHNGNFYKVYKNKINNPILLFEFNNFHEVKTINDKIYFISNNTLYRYDKSGIKTLLTRDEFKYNSKNIYSAYFE